MQRDELSSVTTEQCQLAACRNNLLLFQFSIPSHDHAKHPFTSHCLHTVSQGQTEKGRQTLDKILIAHVRTVQDAYLIAKITPQGQAEAPSGLHQAVHFPHLAMDIVPAELLSQPLTPQPREAAPLAPEKSPVYTPVCPHPTCV